MCSFPVRPSTPCLSISPWDIQLAMGGEVTLKCESNSAEFENFLFKNNNGDTIIQENNTYTIQNISSANSGNYSCGGVVTEGLDSVLTTAAVHVFGKIYLVIRN